MLPIDKVRGELVRTIARERVTVVVGETGSGKTTRLPRYVMEATGGRVAVTQPRRIAAISVARRVASEMGVELGGTVGYRVRFDERAGAATRLKFLTEGMLLREAVADPALGRYDVVFIDEAHERTTNTDILLSLLFHLLTGGRRRRLTVVIMSATLDADALLRFFTTADERDATVRLPPPPLLFVKGRTAPIVHHFAAAPVPDYVAGCVATALQIHRTEPLPEERGRVPCDILVFMTGQEDIDAAFHLLRERARQAGGAYAAGRETDTPPFNVLRLYAALPPQEQDLVFQPSPAFAPPGVAPYQSPRRVIVSTNVAEASLTIPGIRYVVDSGLAKISVNGSLVVRPISRASADQRAGRAGRLVVAEAVGGECFHVYTYADFCKLPATEQPELARCDSTALEDPLLVLAGLGLLGHRDKARSILPRLPVEPSAPLVVEAMLHLAQLGVFDPASAKTSQLRLSDRGKLLLAFPVPPTQAAFLVAADGEGVFEAAATLCAAATAGGELFPSDRDGARAFRCESGDHATVLKCVRECETHPPPPCVSKRTLANILRIKTQLKEIATRVFGGTHNPGAGTEDMPYLSPAYCERLLMCLCRTYAAGSRPGTCRHVARHVGSGRYEVCTVPPTQARIHPACVLCGKRPKFVVFDVAVLTTRLFLRGVSECDPAWVGLC